VQTLKEKKGALYHSAIVCVSHVEHFIFWRGFDQNDGATAHFIFFGSKTSQEVSLEETKRLRRKQ
jgi:hypothetical protein